MLDTLRYSDELREPTGIDLLGENPGIVPSPEWKAKHSKEPWYVGETVISGIGQVSAMGL